MQLSPLNNQNPVLASTRHAIAVVSREGEWLAVNPALCRLLGEPERALLGLATHRRLFPEAADGIEQRLRASTNAAAPALDVAYRRPHDDVLLRLGIAVDALPADAGSAATSFLVQIDDATELRRAEAALEATRRQQEHLAYGISHDLRASLRGIEGFAGQLRRQPLDDAGQEYLGRIRSAAAQAGGLAEALVQLTRAASVAFARDEVDLSLLAAWALAELQDTEPTRAATVEIQPGLAALGDEHQLKRMLQLLLHNAWKFSAGRERAEIAIEGEPTAHGTLVMRVRDNGCGFDMRYADKLFTPFRRLHGSDQGGGHGLGLAIVRTIAERHGGRAWTESVPGTGSRFFVELPAVDAGSEP